MQKVTKENRYVNKVLPVLNKYALRYRKEVLSVYNESVIDQLPQPGYMYETVEIYPNTNWQKIPDSDAFNLNPVEVGSLKSVLVPREAFILRHVVGYVETSRIAIDKKNGYTKFKTMMDRYVSSALAGLEASGKSLSGQQTGRCLIDFPLYGVSDKVFRDVETHAGYEFRFISDCVETNIRKNNP